MQNRQCGVRGCHKTHHPSLHKDAVQDTQITIQKSDKSQDRPLEDKAQCKSLRTVPVVVKYGRNSVKLNALLDDASESSYISSEVVQHLYLYIYSKCINNLMIVCWRMLKVSKKTYKSSL